MNHSIDLDRGIAVFFYSMEENTSYVMLPQYWERYQQLRQEAGYSRSDDSNREKWFLRRVGKALYFYDGSVIWDFEQNPNPNAFSLALSFAFTLAFAFTFAFAPIHSQKDHGAPKTPIPDNFSLLLDLNGEREGFYVERANYRVAGCLGEQTGSLHLHGLTEEEIARLLAVVSQMKGR